MVVDNSSLSFLLVRQRSRIQGCGTAAQTYLDGWTGAKKSDARNWSPKFDFRLHSPGRIGGE